MFTYGVSLTQFCRHLRGKYCAGWSKGERRCVRFGRFNDDCRMIHAIDKSVPIWLGWLHCLGWSQMIWVKEWRISHCGSISKEPYSWVTQYDAVNLLLSLFGDIIWECDIIIRWHVFFWISFNQDHFIYSSNFTILEIRIVLLLRNISHFFNWTLNMNPSCVLFTAKKVVIQLQVK